MNYTIDKAMEFMDDWCQSGSTWCIFTFFRTVLKTKAQYSDLKCQVYTNFQIHFFFFSFFVWEIELHGLHACKAGAFAAFKQD